MWIVCCWLYGALICIWTCPRFDRSTDDAAKCAALCREAGMDRCSSWTWHASQIACVLCALICLPCIYTQTHSEIPYVHAQKRRPALMIPCDLTGRRADGRPRVPGARGRGAQRAWPHGRGERRTGAPTTLRAPPPWLHFVMRGPGPELGPEPEPETSVRPNSLPAQLG